MPFIDPDASQTLKDLREAQGLSPKDLAAEIKHMASRRGAAWTRGAVDEYTIRRIEGKPEEHRHGFVPTIRVQFVIATFFGVDRREIWKPGRKVRVNSDDRKKVAV